MGKRSYKKNNGKRSYNRTDKEKVQAPTKRGANRAYLVPLAFAPCIITTALVQGAAEGFSFRFMFPVAIATIWLIIAAYSMLLKRSFISDISPYLVLPFGLFIRTASTLFKLRGAGKWVVKLVSRGFEVDNPLAKEDYIPIALNTLKGHGRVMQRLNRMQSTIIGRNRRRVVFADWIDAKHILIQGNTGTGKTTVALTMVLSMLMVGPAIFSKWRFKIHDAKHVVGTWFLPLARNFSEKFEIHMEFSSALAAAEALYVEMQKRLTLIGEAGMEPEDAHLDRILFMCDEPQVWYGEGKEGKRYEWLVSQFVNLGRQAGIHVVLVTPYALRDVISTTYRGNLRVISGHMKKNTIASHGIRDVINLKKFEFLYEEDPVDAMVYFQTYSVTRSDLTWVAEGMLDEDVNTRAAGSVDSAELMVTIFANTPECGLRTFQKLGLQHCQALLASGKIDSIPFPWSQIRLVDGTPKPSKKADTWIRGIVENFIEAGIAENTGKGKARRFAVGSATTALAMWREYKEQNQRVGL